MCERARKRPEGSSQRRHQVRLSMTIFAILTMCAMPSSAENEEWPICFNESEWTAFQAEVRKLIRETTEEAVAEAVRPLVIENEGLKEIERRLRKQLAASISCAAEFKQEKMRGRRMKLAVAALCALGGFLLGLVAGQ